jgi:hypothetical protein
MKRRAFPAIALSLCVVLPEAGASAAEGEDAWRSLFNGKDLSGWETYAGTPPGATAPLGAGNDPLGIFTVVEVDGRPAIRISGEVYGALTTLDEFENLHIRLEYRWGERKWPPRAGPRHHRDSGILYWCIGPHGAGSGAWMRSVECNIMEKGTGQWWSVAGVYCDAEAFKLVLDRAPWVPYRGEADGEACYVYQPGFPLVTVTPSDGITPSVDYEKAHGEWNICEVVAWGNIGIHLLNGRVNLVLANPRYREGGVEVPLQRGKIQLQSEGAEVFYRNIEIRPLGGIPPAFRAEVSAPRDDDKGFVPLFSAAEASAWKQCGPGHFTLEDGVATGHGGMGLWWYTRRQFANFVLRGEWLQEEDDADSGVFLRFPDPGNDPWVAVQKGHEMEIGEARPSKPVNATGSIYPFQAPSAVPVKPRGGWNSYEITCTGHNYAVRINGQLVNTWTDPKARSLEGYIGLQNYDDGKTVRHRRLRIKELP